MYDLESKKVEQITNVLGGAFMPTIDSRGTIVYSAYTSRGYKLYSLEGAGPMSEGNYHYLPSKIG